MTSVCLHASVENMFNSVLLSSRSRVSALQYKFRSAECCLIYVIIVSRLYICEHLNCCVLKLRGALENEHANEQLLRECQVMERQEERLCASAQCVFILFNHFTNPERNAVKSTA